MKNNTFDSVVAQAIEVTTFNGGRILSDIDQQCCLRE